MGGSFSSKKDAVTESGDIELGKPKKDAVDDSEIDDLIDQINA